MGRYIELSNAVADANVTTRNPADCNSPSSAARISSSSSTTPIVAPATCIAPWKGFTSNAGRPGICPNDPFLVEVSYRCRQAARSEEHTSELQPLMRISYAVFSLQKKQKS